MGYYELVSHRKTYWNLRAHTEEKAYYNIGFRWEKLLDSERIFKSIRKHGYILIGYP